MGEAGAEVEAKFVPAAHGGGHGEDEQAAGARVERRASPDGAPGVPRDHFLEIRG